MVRKCIEIRDAAAHTDKAYDDCVCLVDVDRHTTLSDACTLANRESILMLVSNLKFEVWLRWHVEDKCSALNSSQLDELTTNRGLVTNKRLAATFPLDAVSTACATALRADPDLRAGRKGPDPSSAMPVLVKLMHQ